MKLSKQDKKELDHISNRLDKVSTKIINIADMSPLQQHCYLLCGIGNKVLYLNFSNILSKKATKELKELRREMQKQNPDGDKIFTLLCGNKYNEPI